MSKAKSKAPKSGTNGSAAGDKTVPLPELPQAQVPIPSPPKSVPTLPKGFNAKEYTFLHIQPADSYFILEAIKDNDSARLREILKSRLLPNDFNLANGFRYQKQEDIDALREIYASILMDAAELGCKIGFRPYQLSIWLSIVVKTTQETLARIKKQGSCSVAEWTDLFKDHFFRMAALQEEEYKPLALFTEIECKNVIEYMVQGYGQHSNLYKFVVRQPQEIRMHRIEKSIELGNFPFPKLSTAIPELNWPEYCRKQEELEMKEAQERMDRIQADITRQAEALEKQEAEQKTRDLKGLIADAEREMRTPLPPYPVPPPSIPTIDQIFRKQVVTIPEVVLNTSSPSTSIAESPNSASLKPTPSGKSDDKKGSAKKSPKGAPHILSIKRARDLVAPPDIFNLKPLEKSKFVTPVSLLPPPVEVLQPEQSKIEYIDIPINQSLSRQEATEIVSLNVSMATEEYKQWVYSLVAWEEAQWTERLQVLQKAKADLAAHLKIQDEKAKAKAAADKAASAAKSKK